MNRHQKLDLVLKYMSKNLEATPRRPDAIIKSSKLNIENAESYRMFKMMLSDGYVYEHDNIGVYGITYKGLLFLENGGYEFEHSKYKLERKTTKISNKVDIFLKPIGIITALLVIAWYIIKFLEFFGVINSCIN